MRILVTRPAAQADAWVDSLASRGVNAVALPLIGISPPVDGEAVLQAWRELSRYALVVFVSPNAVEEFFRVRSGSAWPATTMAASVGPGSTSALMKHGVPAVQIAEPAADAIQFDSEALWRRLSQDDWAGRSALIVRGDGGRDWLANTLRLHGAIVSFVAAYRRIAPSFDGVLQALLNEAIEHPMEHLWLFSSSEAISNLESLTGPHSDARWASARAIATHPRIAQRARDCGFGVVCESAPTLEGVVACIQSIAS